MNIRQSDLKTFDRCALQWRYQNIDHLPREQSGSLTYGSIIHEAVLLLEQTHDLDRVTQWFRDAWLDPTTVNPEYTIDYFVRGTNWKKFADQGVQTLKDWWSLIQWDTDVVLAREYFFDVPIGDGHRLQGTLDKLTIRFRPAIDQYVILISDYKTNNKIPTYEWLEDDLQFTAYAYATHQEDFWTGITNGKQLMVDFADAPRYGEWVSLTHNKRMDAGVRTPVHFNRLEYACNQFALSVAMRIFVPTLTGEACRYCDFRRQCGLREIED